MPVDFKEEVNTFWKAFCAENSSPAEADEFSAWSFGDHPDLADELAGLVKRGIKTATCCSLLEIQAVGEPVPQVGDFSVILDGQGKPVCIIRTDDVCIIPFNEVGAEFAFEEGEDDRSLAAWREGHWRYFTRVHAAVKLPLTETIPVVCERFHVVYRADEP